MAMIKILNEVAGPMPPPFHLPTITQWHFLLFGTFWGLVTLWQSLKALNLLQHLRHKQKQLRKRQSLIAKSECVQRLPSRLLPYIYDCPAQQGFDGPLRDFTCAVSWNLPVLGAASTHTGGFFLEQNDDPVVESVRKQGCKITYVCTHFGELELLSAGVVTLAISTGCKGAIGCVSLCTQNRCTVSAKSVLDLQTYSEVLGGHVHSGHLRVGCVDSDVLATLRSRNIDTVLVDLEVVNQVFTSAQKLEKALHTLSLQNEVKSLPPEKQAPVMGRIWTSALAIVNFLQVWIDSHTTDSFQTLDLRLRKAVYDLIVMSRRLAIDAVCVKVEKDFQFRGNSSMSVGCMPWQDDKLLVVLAREDVCLKLMQINSSQNNA